MRHIGQLFLSRQRPQAALARCGTFQLQLLAYDRIGPHQTEPWRIVWTGIAAKRFWQLHEADLNPGAVLNVTREAARTHTLYTRPPTAEVQARVVSMELVTKPQPCA
ncbi:hypothetical protein [Comamonas terrigena]|uniref:hypothetical protein n=1 Tax=Comamonas terrigena TaxID=32013 RepID=UPI0024496BEB|nr:hypothetical protein [Comamonas terrigena]MDH1700312.1 hypothetical protein [Comamonas terrigena]